MLTVFSILPIAVALGLMVLAKLPASRALLVAFLTALVSALLVWKMPARAVAAFSLLGLLKALDILLIVFGALFLLNMLKQTQLLPVLNSSFSRLSADHRVQALLIAWLFSAFMEGAAGFGTPAALAAPLLVSMGFPPLAASLLALVGNTTPVPFAAVGIPTLTTLTTLSADIRELGVSEAAFARDLTAMVARFMGVGGLLIPTAMIFILTVLFGKKRRLRAFLEFIPFSLFSGLALVLPYYLLARFLGPEFPAIVGSLLALILIVAAIKGRFLLPTHVWRLDEKADRSYGQEPDQADDAPVRRWAAWLPYVAIALILLLTRLPQLGLGALLKKVALVVPGLLGVSSATYRFEPLYNAGLVPFMLVAWLTGRVRKLPRSDRAATLRATAKQIKPIALALFSAVALVHVMMHSHINTPGYPGMLTHIARQLADRTGAFFPLFSPLIGMLGSFISGSCTVSSIMFSSLQFQTALMLGLSPVAVVALQVAGGAIGSMICINSVIAVASTTGLSGQEGALIKKTLLPALLYAASAVVVSWFWL